MSISVVSGAATSVGRVRTLNEDALLTIDGLFVIADGMGGHAAGDRASAMAVAAMQRLARTGIIDTNSLSRTICAANEEILAESQHTGGGSMGTTITGMASVTFGGAQHWLVFNIGDSRVYAVETGHLRALTKDHSEVQELIDAGRITEEQARVHPRRNVVTRSLGTDSAPPVVDHWLLPVTEDQTFLICSDGLTEELENDQIAAVIAGSPDAQSAAESLVTTANAAGGRDNVSVIVLSTIGAATDSEQLDDTLPRGKVLEET